MFYVSLVGNTGLAAAADVLSCVERIGHAKTMTRLSKSFTQNGATCQTVSRF